MAIITRPADGIQSTEILKAAYDSSLTTRLTPKLSTVNCQGINWTTWNSFTGNAATGMMNDGDKNITVTMSSNFLFGSTPQIYGYEKFGAYSSIVPNVTVPKTTWAEGTGGVTTMHFSEKVTNPILLISSLGSSVGSSTLEFSSPYIILYDGGGIKSNSSTSITGTEGYAIIMFLGELNGVTINSNNYEYYTNITWGIKPQSFPVDVIEQKDDCGNIVLKASGGVYYQWNDGDTPNSATNTFHKNGTYVVTVTNAYGCTAVASKSVTVNKASVASITGKTSGCESVTLTANGGISYFWNGGNNPYSATNTFTKSGIYTVVATTASGCTTTASQTITIGPSPIIITGKTTGCGEVLLTATGGTNYNWNGGNTPDNAANTFTKSGVYSVTATDANGCLASASVNVVVNDIVVPSVNISVSPVEKVCPGTPLTFTAFGINAGSAPVYQWYKNNKLIATGKTYTANDFQNDDEVSCKLVSAATCAVPETIASNKIVAAVKSPIKIIMEPVVAVNYGEKHKLSPLVSSKGVQRCLWSPSNGLSNPLIINPEASPLATTNYQLTVTSVEGCEVNATVEVDVVLGNISIPNTFTPNGDGINDNWAIASLDVYPNLTVDVYNRYGELVYHSMGYEKPWNGTSKGQVLPAGNYYYLINPHYKDLKARTGYVMIIR